MKTKREKLLEKALEVAMTSLSTYGSHPIIEHQSKSALHFPEEPEPFQDTEADGYEYCGKCGKLK